MRKHEKNMDLENTWTENPAKQNRKIEQKADGRTKNRQIEYKSFA
jgi:hypothetical protein